MFDFLGNIALNLLLSLGLAALLIPVPFAGVRGLYARYVPSIRHILVGGLCFFFLFVQGVLFWNAFSSGKCLDRMEETVAELLTREGNDWQDLPSGRQWGESKGRLGKCLSFFFKIPGGAARRDGALPETAGGVVHGAVALLKQHSNPSEISGAVCRDALQQEVYRKVRRSFAGKTGGGVENRLPACG